MTERRADDATRDVVGWLKCEYLQDHVGDVYSGVISAVTGFGLFVELDDLYVEGLIHVTALPKDYYRFEQAHQRLIGERSGKRYHLGDSVTVQVARVNLEERKVDFILQELVSRTRKNRAKGGSSETGATKVSTRAMEMAVDHQVDRERRGKQKKDAQRTTGGGPWGGSAKTAVAVPPFRKRKVGASEAVPVEASEEQEQSTRKEAASEGAAKKSEEDAAPKRRGARRTPPRKGGKRPAVAARKATQKTGKGKASTVKAKKKKASSNSKKKK